MKKLLPLALALFMCSQLPAQFTSFMLNMNFENTQRSFFVHLPTGFTNAQHLPLVLNLHGSGSDGPQQEYYSKMSYTADSNNFVVVYPNGIGNEWNVGFNSPYHSGINDVGFISKVIDTLQQLYNIDLSRVYSCGMSDGGFMSHRLACEIGGKLAAIATVSGVPTDSAAFYCPQFRHIPVMHVHGTADPLVFYSGYTGGDTSFLSAEQTVEFWLAKNTCSITNDTTFLPDVDPNDSSTVQKIHYGSCFGNTQVLFYKIIGGGHSWPNAPLDYIYGPTNRDIDGSTEIWNFFKQYTNLAASIDDPEQNDVELKVYPNPSAGDFKIEADDNIERVRVLNVLGENVFASEIAAPNVTLHLNALANGVYFLRVEGKDFQAVRKVVKE